MKKEIKIVFSISFIFYLLVLVFILFLGFRGYRYDLPFLEYMKNSSNFVPFKTINTYFQAILDRSINLDIPIKNLFGNFVLFLPMGIYLPFFIKKTNKVMVFSISMIVLLFIIEVMQLVTRKGSFDVDDFILNMPGALIGFGIWRTKFVQNLLK
ncbi:VanZ family protein [Sporosarcina psychrophila]|uniref:VanZ family protein n=1 Tax=Sporosarcina psychrophila TaxID=1476 RepID=UPI00078ED655|nr:VanZ family protein [Sporosarcina psychrophila]AMQ05428.1 vanZ like family protein [Sporosarcina psychrophila]